MSTPVLDIRAEARVFDSAVGSHLLLADGSRVFDLDRETARMLLRQSDRGEVPEELADLIGTEGRRYTNGH